MNDNQTTPNQPPKIPSFAQVKNNIGPLIKDVFGKLYTNKMAFYLVCGAFGLILIILIAGVIYKMSGNIGPKANATPMPVSQNQNSQIQEKELSPLDKMDNDLKAVKVRIDNLDVKQLPLTPPTINYKINF